MDRCGELFKHMLLIACDTADASAPYGNGMEALLEHELQECDCMHRLH